MGLMIPWLGLAVFKSRSGHAFPDAAFLDEVAFESANLLIEQVIGLVDQADRDIGHDFCGARFAKLAISLIRHIRPIAQLPHVKSFLRIFVSGFQIAHTQEILVIDQQFLETRASHIGQLDLGLG